MDQKHWLTPFGYDAGWESPHYGMISRYFNNLLHEQRYGPSIDLHETDREVFLTAEIPGVKPEDLDLTIHQDAVILKGETHKAADRDERGYRLSERQYGSFYRTVHLPARVVPHEATAKYNHGVLEVKIPKADYGTPEGFKPTLETEEKH